jgi:hypothetical protein
MLYKVLLIVNYQTMFHYTCKVKAFMRYTTSMSDTPDLSERATAILKENDHGLYTIPAQGLYPHQWLWDSCFIAIGQRHYDVERAKMEILSLLRGQWSNGMMPHMIFDKDSSYRRDHNFWRSWVSPYAPDEVFTSGITQPPVLAEAIVKIGEKMDLVERRSWYRQVYPGLLSYHQWLYNDRDPHHEGLTLQIHPWETGLDTNPAWMAEMHEHLLPWWVGAVQKTHLDVIINMFRRDHMGGMRPRYNTIDALTMFDAQRRLRRKEYNIDRILSHSLFTIEDVAFNAILIRANDHLISIARSLRQDIPEDLLKRFSKSRRAFEGLWDPYTETYYSRDFVTHKLIKEPTIATLLPLYAGCIDAERAAILVKKIENAHLFGSAFPIPSTPLNSTWFNPEGYWQGPTWLNTNWMIIDGLKRYGYKHHAEALIESSLELVEEGGFYEYFNPISGKPLGARNFSWSAAVALDWLKS